MLSYIKKVVQRPPVAKDSIFLRVLRAGIQVAVLLSWYRLSYRNTDKDIHAVLRPEEKAKVAPEPVWLGGISDSIERWLEVDQTVCADSAKCSLFELLLDTICDPGPVTGAQEATN
jgi:hypothetical protein